MAGNTITQSAPARSAGPPHPPSVAQSRAARELGLKRGEFDLAVQLGLIRTVADEGGGKRRVARTEIDRVRSAEGFPDALLERVRAVGTSEGAEIVGITPARFTKLAKVGLLTPVKFYLNRYRAVVWLYLADELREFAAAQLNRPLLTGRTPERFRTQLDAGTDQRARNWRGRHTGYLLRQTDDPWERAAITASLLDPVQVAEIVDDPYERAHLNRLMPDRPAHGAPDSPSAQVVARLLTADDPDEIQWVRAGFALCLTDARETCPAPRPAALAAPSTGDAWTPPPPPEATEQPRGLVKWLRRRRA